MIVLAGSLAGWAGESVKSESQKERIDQPPAKRAAADDLAARSPAPIVATGPYVSTQVNVDSLGLNIVGDAANEPSIAVNPLNPSNMVIGWRQFNTVSSNWREAGWAYTFDRGATWHFPGSIDPEFRSDPTIDVDSSGNFYYQTYKVVNQFSDGFTEVVKSTNGGVTWGPAVFSFGGDKPWLAIDRTGGPGNGYIYNIWSALASNTGSRTASRSIDGGLTYEDPVTVPESPRYGTLVVGPDGTAYAAGIEVASELDPSLIVAARTTNAPDPSVAPAYATTPASLGGSMGLSKAPNPVGLLGQANMMVDLSSGPTGGNVYVLATVTNGPTGADVRMTRSVNHGAAFGVSTRINDDPEPPIDTDSTTWHWMAAGAISPNGRIDAIWLDTRESGVNNLCRLYYAYSWDGGTSWSPNVAVSPQFNSWLGWPQQNKMGDYFTLVSDTMGADAAYCATFNGEQDVYYVRLFPDCNGNGVSDVSDVAAHTSLDCNLNHIPDECETALSCIGAGSVSETGTSGAALTIGKLPGGDIMLTWGASCAPADADYAVYEGALGSFRSRAPRTCSTGGQLSFGMTPAVTSSYYLVVPVHADREGSCGTDGTGAQRPPSAGACFPQTLAACGI